MKIEIPVSKAKLSQTPWRYNAVKAFNGGVRDAVRDYEIRLGGCYYYPYWIGKVRTEKERPLFGIKVIDFYVVCDAVNGGYIVLRNLPKLQEREEVDNRLLELKISRKHFEQEIMKEGIEDRIERQFIFGKPLSKREGCWVVYIPAQEVLIRRKDSGRAPKRFFANVYTGEVKSI